MDGSALNDWEDVSGTPFSALSSVLSLQPPAPLRPPYDEECSIFPPRDHEGLPVMALHHPPNSNQPQREKGLDEGEDSSGGDGSLLPRARVGLLRASKMLGLALRVLWYRIQKLYWILCAHWRFPVSVAFSPMATAGSALAMLGLLLIIIRHCNSRKVWRKNAILLLQIQEKDQQIRRLQHQLSQIKEEMPCGFHVPVLRNF